MYGGKQIESLNKNTISLYVTELCEVSCIDEKDEDKDFSDEKLYEKRTYCYKTNSGNFEDAMLNFINDFDITCVKHCSDEFAGECLNSKVIKIEVA